MDNGIIYAIISLAVGFVLAAAARGAVRWLKKYAETTDTQWDDIIIAAFGTPVQVGIIAVSAYISLKYFGIVPEQYAWILSDQILNSLYILLGTWIVGSLLHDIILVYGHSLADKSEEDWDDRLIEFLELAAKYIVWFAGFMLILVNLKIDITPFLAGAGIAGLAFALAAQDLISNFFGGAIITMDKPFKLNDRIKVDNYIGDVVNVGPRSTRIRTIDYQIVTIPNNKITSNIIVNYAEPDQKLRITVPVSVAYGSDVAKVKSVLLAIADDAIANTPYILADPAPRVFFLEFGDSNLKFVLYVWSKVYNTPDEVRVAINVRIDEKFRNEGIEVPVPQLEVTLKQ